MAETQEQLKKIIQEQNKIIKELKQEIENLKKFISGGNNNA